MHDLCGELGLRCQVDITVDPARAWTKVGDRNRLAHPADRALERCADRGEFVCAHHLLHALEQLAFLCADVLRQQLGCGKHLFTRGRVGPCKVISQLSVLAAQTCCQWPEVLKAVGGREDQLFLRSKMRAAFTGIKFFQFAPEPRQCRFVEIVPCKPTTHANAQRQPMLMLMRKRKQIAIAQHAAILLAQSCQRD